MQVYIYNGRVTSYFITTEGKCYNSKTKNWLKGQISKNGYLSYHLSIDGDKVRKYAHRMVLETFLPNKNVDLEINHKDGNKLNNSLSNLEWVTSSQNKQHAIENNLYKVFSVYCFDENKQLISEFKNFSLACSFLKLNPSSLRLACEAEIKTLYKGYYWSYTNDNTFLTKTNINNGKAKPVAQFLLDGTLIAKYKSCADAARKTGYVRTRISECCNKKQKTYKGFIWNFINKDIV